MKKYSKIRIMFSNLNKKIIGRVNFGNKSKKFMRTQVSTIL